MNYEEWQKNMLAQGYQKLFLDDLGKGSVMMFTKSLKYLASQTSSSNETLFTELAELEGYALKYCLKELLLPIEKFKVHLEAKDRDESRKQIKLMALAVRDFKQMVFSN